MISVKQVKGKNMKQDDRQLIIDKDLEDLVPGYVSSIISDLGLIIQAVKESDFDTAKTLSHRMKGSGGGYGIQEISDKGWIMEKASAEKNSDSIKEAAEALIRYLENIELKYE